MPIHLSTVPENIHLTSVADIHKFSYQDIVDAGIIKLNNTEYHVRELDNDIFLTKGNSGVIGNLCTSMSKSVSEEISVLAGFFSRCVTPGANYFQTVENQLSDLIQLKNPTKEKHLTDSYNVKHLNGANRDVYLTPTGQGFKVGKGDNAVKDKEMDRRSQLLNEIYSNPKFYDGKYAKYANMGSLKLTTENGKEKIATSFQVIKEAIPLTFKKLDDGVSNEAGTYEKIPQSAIDELVKAGYNPWDVKPDNFVKIKNETNGWDYLPIDAKFIGRTEEGRDTSQPMSPRTRQVNQLQSEAKSQFDFGGMYIDKLA
ncbi:hypothetical protein [uncultured Shewanella sp.]|uniref:hypothetical protein n=1 Tax=uncultured Shewanella sp. TaxID=173975 RepID=UPI00261F1F68|nr:hypothetical protein [uncultured Shewanella sp.]